MSRHSVHIVVSAQVHDSLHSAAPVTMATTFLPSLQTPVEVSNLFWPVSAPSLRSNGLWTFGSLKSGKAVECRGRTWTVQISSALATDKKGPPRPGKKSTPTPKTGSPGGKGSVAGETVRQGKSADDAETLASGLTHWEEDASIVEVPAGAQKDSHVAELENAKATPIIYKGPPEGDTAGAVSPLQELSRKGGGPGGSVRVFLSESKDSMITYSTHPVPAGQTFYPGRGGDWLAGTHAGLLATVSWRTGPVDKRQLATDAWGEGRNRGSQWVWEVNAAESNHWTAASGRRKDSRGLRDKTGLPGADVRVGGTCMKAAHSFRVSAVPLSTSTTCPSTCYRPPARHTPHTRIRLFTLFHTHSSFAKNGVIYHMIAKPGQGFGRESKP